MPRAPASRTSPTPSGVAARRAGIASVAAGLIAAAAATADVLVELGSGDAVSGTFLPAGETESYRFALPAGARLTVVAQGTRSGARRAPRVRLALLDPEGTDLTTAGAIVLPIAAGAKVSSFRIPRSGTYTAVLTSGATGAYAFRASWRAAARPRRTTVVFPAPGEETTVLFAADAGATATVTIAATQSPSVPRLVRIASRDGSWTSGEFAAPLNASARTHTVRGVRLADRAGDYVLTVREDGAAAGAATVSVALTPPKVKPRRVDVTTRQTGRSVLDNEAVGGPVGRAGGRIDAGVDERTPIGGASLVVPARALAKPALVVVSTSDPLRPATGRPRGPAVSVGPPGLVFRAVRQGAADAARVTLPFDAEPFRGDFATLRVRVRDARGRIRRVEPSSAYVIDAAAGTVTFPVATGGAFQAFGPAAPRPADLDGDGLDDLVVPAPYAAGGAGAVLVWFGRADFATRPPSAPDLTIPGPAGDVAFGTWTAVGDVNGDGFADLAATSRNEEFGVFGRVHVFFGGAGFPAAAADAVVTGTTAAGDSFGRRLTIADATGDGTADLVIGAAATTFDLVEQGAVFVAPGGPAFASHPSSDPAVLRIRGGVERLGFGRAVAVGTLGAGATPYLLVAADLGSTLPLQGRVYLVPAGPGLAAGVVATDAVRISGDAAGDRFGADVAVADVDLDGANDLVVGAPGMDVPGDTTLFTDAGNVYVFLGKSGFATSFAAAADVRLSGGAAAGEARGAYLATGRFLGSAPRDLAFGSPFRDETASSQTGALQIQRAGPQFPAGSVRATGREPLAHFGRVLPAVDLNGDGRDEIVVAAPGASGGRGEVTVVFGPGGFAGRSVVLVGPAAGDQLGGE